MHISRPILYCTYFDNIMRTDRTIVSIRRSSAAAEMARVGGHYAVRGEYGGFSTGSVFIRANMVTLDRFICFILTVKQSAALAACVLRTTTKKGRQLFLTKKVDPVT